ncbi:MAG: hypothetical protein Q8O37_16185 [Sulfuricellaceae bacterium]|nr:hypothetical protein [Sulfuricellaceae bacterium]
MTARKAENDMLMRCASAARNPAETAQDQREANVFRVAAMVVQSRLPGEAASLMQVSNAYFFQHPAERLSAADVVQKGWVFNLPRLRDMLSFKLLKE